MQTSNNRIWLGVILIVLGALFVLDNFGFFYFDFHPLIFSWHTIFLIIGIVLVVNHKNSFIGYVFLGIGLIGILHHFPYFFFLDFGSLWPLLFLALGVWLLLNRGNSHHHEYHKIQDNIQNAAPGQQTNFSSYDLIDEVAVFNTVRRTIDSQNFRGGKITTMFGGAKLDLTNAKLAPGENSLEVSAIFGGVNIRVPQNWKVLVNVTSIFGGFDDKRFTKTTPPDESQGILIIKGAAIFGGGELLY
ncbi:MAG: cell wall-active antibiotics response protein [Bacteroidetes bacterium]|nr:cell wall-active antibiotics response protein [Bacteroidota bacterium]MCL6098343.1 cell wall-active antibiotics response protein [Bacteroidota bacterium]